MENTRAECWAQEERRLLLGIDEFDSPLDAGVRDLVIALRLLGYPTIGSCEGHPHKAGEELMFPFVGIRYRLPRRFERNPVTSEPSPLWLDPRLGSRRERAYLAAVGWRVYRPMAWRLRGLLEQHGADADFRVRASWTGLAIEPREPADVESLPEPEISALIERWGERLRELGARLRQDWLSARAPASAGSVDSLAPYTS